MQLEIPKRVQGTAVIAVGDPFEFKGETWITLVPDNSEDERIWEFNLKSGRVLATRG